MNREVRGALAGGGWKKAVSMPAQKKNLFYKSEFLYYRNKKDAVADPGEERFSASVGPIHPSDRMMQSW